MRVVARRSPVVNAPDEIGAGKEQNGREGAVARVRGEVVALIRVCAGALRIRRRCEQDAVRVIQRAFHRVRHVRAVEHGNARGIARGGNEEFRDVNLRDDRSGVVPRG